jgi:hypothetical protein
MIRNKEKDLEKTAQEGQVNATESALRLILSPRFLVRPAAEKACSEGLQVDFERGLAAIELKEMVEVPLERRTDAS